MKYNVVEVGNTNKYIESYVTVMLRYSQIVLCSPGRPAASAQGNRTLQRNIIFHTIEA